MKLINTSIYSALLVIVLSSYSFADCSYELFNISSTKDTKIIEFIEQLSDECEFSIIVSDSNTEKVLQSPLNKTHLKNLTIDEVLSIVLTENNLTYKLENNILRVSYLGTRVFSIDYILSQRKGSGSTDITLSSSSSNSSSTNGSPSSGGTGSSSTANSSQSGQNSSSSESGIKIESSDEVQFWEALDLELQRVLNRPNDVYKAEAPIINRNAGLITVTASIEQMNRLEEYLQKLQEKVQLQVLIDVQLLTVTMSKGKTTGVDWKQLYALQNIELSIDKLDYQNVSKFENGSITEALYGGGRDVASLVNIKAGGSLQEVIKFLQTQGDVNSISNPKVLTLNNQPALITAGTEYFYKIQQSTNQQGTGGGVAATTQNDSVQSVFAGILLDITPEISDDKTITLKINPSLSETRSDITQQASTDRVMPPDLNRRQLSSVVTVKDGNRIILGGLINTKNSNIVNFRYLEIFRFLVIYLDMKKTLNKLKNL
jgi:general secretion pathway protein D